MNKFSALLVVVPWYVSLFVYWLRIRIPIVGLLEGMFSANTVILTFFFLVFLPGVALYVAARWGAKRKRHNELLYLFLTALVGVAIGFVGSDFWMVNAVKNNSLVWILGLIVLLSWKFIWDFQPTKF